jgi:hypothetical protein
LIIFCSIVGNEKSPCGFLERYGHFFPTFFFHAER